MSLPEEGTDADGGLSTPVSRCLTQGLSGTIVLSQQTTYKSPSRSLERASRVILYREGDRLPAAHQIGDGSLAFLWENWLRRFNQRITYFVACMRSPTQSLSPAVLRVLDLTALSTRTSERT